MQAGAPAQQKDVICHPEWLISTQASSSCDLPRMHSSRIAPGALFRNALHLTHKQLSLGPLPRASSRRSSGGSMAQAQAHDDPQPPQPQHPTPPVIHFATGNKKKLEEVRIAAACSSCARQPPAATGRTISLRAPREAQRRRGRARGALARTGAPRPFRTHPSTTTWTPGPAPTPLCTPGGGHPGSRPEAAVHG